MAEANLYSGYFWDCEHCGTENFVRAIEGSIRVNVNQETHAKDFHFDSPEAENGIVPFVVSRISIFPKVVKCKTCKSEFHSQLHINAENG